MNDYISFQQKLFKIADVNSARITRKLPELTKISFPKSILEILLYWQKWFTSIYVHAEMNYRSDEWLEFSKSNVEVEWAESLISPQYSSNFCFLLLFRPGLTETDDGSFLVIQYAIERPSHNMMIISKINVKTFAAVEPTSNPKIILSVITLSIDGSAVGDSEGLAKN